MRKVLRLLLCPTTLVFLAGHSQCSYNRYEIEMVPSGQELVRTITCSRHQPGEPETEIVDFDPQELLRIASLYSERLSQKDDKVHTFRDVFLHSTPPDVGGAGRYIHLTSLLGDTSAYSERFRGDDDQAGQLERALEAVDKLMDYGKGWLAAELKDHPGLPRLLAFYDRQLKRDLHNLVVYAALAARFYDIDETTLEEMGIRVIQYLFERGYLSVEGLPAAASAYFRAELKVKAPEFMVLLRRLVVRELGVAKSEPIPEALDFLADPSRAKASFYAYLRTTAGFKNLTKECKKKRLLQPDVPEPNPEALLLKSLNDLLFIDLGPHHRLNVKLKVPAEPFATNGTWNYEEKRVEWIDRSIKGKTGLPTFLYAFWAKPNEKFQKKHFGKVALSGKDLGEYVLWHSGLTTAEGIEWNDFLRSLKPGSDIPEHLASFRFSGEKDANAPVAGSCSLAETPLKLILLGLSTKQK